MASSSTTTELKEKSIARSLNFARDCNVDPGLAIRELFMEYNKQGLMDETIWSRGSPPQSNPDGSIFRKWVKYHFVQAELN